MNAKEKELEKLLTPDELLEKPDDPLEGTPAGNTPEGLRVVEDPAKGLDALVPDELKPRSDDPNLEDDPLGLTPDALRSKKPGADPLGYPGADEKPGPPAEVEAAAVQTPVAKDARISLGEWAEKWGKEKDERLDRQEKTIEEEKREIREAFERVIAKRKAEDLTPDDLK